MDKIFHSYIDSPIGNLAISASETGLLRLSLVEEDPGGVPNFHTLQSAVQLGEYFEGDRKVFDLKFDLNGSHFFREVWDLVYQIPYGQTSSYMAIAKKMNKPGAVRAVGMANGKNPIPIIIPCHRVIGSDGSLTGYALGLDIKKRLLALENPKSLGYQSSLF